MSLIFVDNRSAYFQLQGSERKPITGITAEELEKAVCEILKHGYSSEGNPSDIANPAERIMFEQLAQSFDGLDKSRTAIKDEIDSKFAEAEKKYLA